MAVELNHHSYSAAERRHVWHIKKEIREHSELTIHLYDRYQIKPQITEVSLEHIQCKNSSYQPQISTILILNHH